MLCTKPKLGKRYICSQILSSIPSEQVLWWAVSWLNADVEERREERGEAL
jgi:hypothetical protein